MMTTDEFNNTSFTGGMIAEYRGKNYDVVSCDFMKKTICIDIDSKETWLPCEVITIVEKSA